MIVPISDSVVEYCLPGPASVNCGLLYHVEQWKKEMCHRGKEGYGKIKLIYLHSQSELCSYNTLSTHIKFTPCEVLYT